MRRCTVGLMLLAGTELLLQGAEKKTEAAKQTASTRCSHHHQQGAASTFPQGGDDVAFTFLLGALAALQTQPRHNEAFQVASCPAEIFCFTGKMGHLA